MKFELKPDNRNSSDEELIKDLVSVAQKLNKSSVTRSEYDKYGRYSEGTIRKRFGGWLKSLEKAGLTSTKDYFVTDEQLVDELKRIAELPDVKTLSRDVFNKYKSVSSTGTIERRFGSWSKALKKSGLATLASQSRYSDEDLFRNLLNVWAHYGRQPIVTEMGELPSKISPNTYSNRFGDWRKALEAFVEYANKGEEEAFSKNEELEPEKTNSSSIRTQHRTSRGINVRLRFLVMKKDNFKCKNCGRSPATDPSIILHVDHVQAWVNGGETVLQNLQTLCSKCNLGKSDL